MCGIVGYVGEREVAGVLLDGLRRLEYRGYDSAGVAIQQQGRLTIVRAVGKLDHLAQALAVEELPGTVGIGHTRWATHGRPNEVNAHPHRAGPVAVVHNGIIENHVALKRELEAEGVKFSSDTDTEIVAHLIHRALSGFEESHGSRALLEAMRSALGRIRGAYALVAVSEHAPDRLVVARNASPLVIGLGDGETLCASDIPALLSYTREVVFLEDGELAELTRSGAHIEKLDGTPVSRPPRTIHWSPVQAEKGGFKHFMLKEIFEQPRAIEDTLRGRVRLGDAAVELEEFGLSREQLAKIERVYFVACGTSYHASLAGRHYVEQLARLPAQCELASEVRYRDPVFSEKDLVVAVSQSGETADTIAALLEAKRQGATILALTNVVESAIARAAHATFYTHAGPEIGVASTKAFTTQLVGMLLLAVHLGRETERLSRETATLVLQALLEVPSAIRDALQHADQVAAVARRWQKCEHMLFLGRGLGFPIALEGALKLKEISYAHAEGYAAGEMKHGPIALIDDKMPVVVVIPENRQYEKTFSNLEEVRAREGQVIALASVSDDKVRALTEDVLSVPRVAEWVEPIVCAIPLQLLAYYIADMKGTDVDQPRNLAKTVTVE